MKLINNVTETLKDDLSVEIHEGSKLSIAAACFSIYAFQELKKQLTSIDELRFIFTAPTFVTEKAKKEKREFYIPRLNRERNLYGTEFEIKLRNELTQKAIARECAEWIKKKAVFKSNKSNEDMMGFMNVDDKNYMPITEFSTVGLGCERGNNAYNYIQKTDAPMSSAYLSLFDQLWNDKSKLQDVTDEVIDSITAAYNENAPDFIYFVTLYNIFNEFLEDISEDELPNEATGFKDSKIWSMLYNFQKDAALAIINKLEKYNGCILADSVGLGKTFTALAVIKYYESKNKSVLVLCPKKLANNWNTYKDNYINNPIASDRLGYDVLYHTDLNRTHGQSNGLDLDRINWGNYGLVVIDESHNFRNGGKIVENPDEETKDNRYVTLMKKDPEWIYNISEVFTTSNITKLIINFTKRLDEYRSSKGETLSDEEQDLISENITALSNLKQHTLPVFDIKANAEEEDVSEIFVRVNSGGVALKQNDFILTLLSLYWDEGRKEIEQFSMESTYPSKDKITSYNQLTEVTAQDVIRVVMAYAFDRARLKYGYKLLRGADFDKKGAVDETLRDQRFDVLKAKLPDVLNVHNWHEFLKSIMNAGYLSGDLILSGNAIYYTYAFYLIAKYRFNASYNENLHLTSLWFFYASLVSLYTGSFESTVENHLNSIKELTSLEEYKRFILSRVEERLTNDYFDITLIGSEGLAVSGRGNNAWNAYVAALNILNVKILFSKSNLLVSKLFEPGTDGKRKSLEKHHLFPKAYLKTLGYNDAKINQMANYAFIDWKDNMEILDEAPSIYYPVVCEGRSPEEIQRMEEENALPHGWENMPYEDFLIERRKLMAAKIKAAFEQLKKNVE